jgi:hypothetical protein
MTPTTSLGARVLVLVAVGTALGCGSTDHESDAGAPPNDAAMFVPVNDFAIDDGGGDSDGGGGDGAIAGPVKYLSQLGAKCDGSDDTLAVIAAVTNARNDAYTLIVDCVATLDIGTNIDRSVFIDNNTTIVFGSAGKFIINNLFEPAFVIANTENVTLTNRNI